MRTDSSNDLQAMVLVAGAIAVGFAIAVSFLSSDVAGGPSEFFGCGLIAYAAMAFGAAFVGIVVLRWVTSSLRSRRWRGNPRLGLALVAVIAGLVWAGSGLVTWGGRQVRASRAFQESNPSRLAELGRLALERRDDLLAKALVQNAGCPAEVLASLAEADWPELLEWKDTLSHSLRGDRRPVLMLVALHPNSPVATLELLAERTPALAAKIVGHPSVTGALLEKLAERGDRHIDLALAANRRTPPGVLRRLAGSSEWEVRRAAAGNEELDAQALVALAQDPETGVRRALLSNDRLPSEALAVLATDSDQRIQNVARKRLEREGRD